MGIPTHYIKTRTVLFKNPKASQIANGLVGDKVLGHT